MSDNNQESPSQQLRDEDVKWKDLHDDLGEIVETLQAESSNPEEIFDETKDWIMRRLQFHLLWLPQSASSLRSESPPSLVPTEMSKEEIEAVSLKAHTAHWKGDFYHIFTPFGHWHEAVKWALSAVRDGTIRLALTPESPPVTQDERLEELVRNEVLSRYGLDPMVKSQMVQASNDQFRQATGFLECVDWMLRNGMVRLPLLSERTKR